MIAQVPERVMDTVRSELAMRGLGASYTGDFAMSDDINVNIAKPKCMRLRTRRVNCTYKFDLVIGGVIVYRQRGRVKVLHGKVRVWPYRDEYATRVTR